MKEQIEDLEEDVAGGVAGGGGQGKGNEGGKISNMQRKFNERAEKRIIDLETEVQRLQRIDFRLNKELT